ncbi:MAG: leucine-rich repeat protein [Saccharofermentans sp.]|nr:leucine-rich repeat protein [Saccharofermentans sp.]
MKKSGIITSAVTLLVTLLLVAGEFLNLSIVSANNYTTYCENRSCNTIYYGKNGKNEFLFNYSDSLFFSDSMEINGDIAKMCVCLAVGAYGKDIINETLLEKSLANIVTVGMGFKIVKQMNYELVDSMTLGRDDLDIVAFTIAKKEIANKIVYCVPVKGTSGNAEWYSNFNLGTGDDHEGFRKAAYQVYENLIDTISNDDYSDEDTIVLTTGHSRGAAVSNIVSGWLTLESLSGEMNIPQKQIFSYNFACPAVSRNADTTLMNIYNYNNPGDLIPLLPIESWGYKRYGHTIDYFSNISARDNTFYQFKRTTKSDCRSEITPERYKVILESCFSTPDDFRKPETQLLFRIMSYFLFANGKDRGELKAVFSCDSYKGAIASGLVIAETAESFIDEVIGGSHLNNSRVFLDGYCEKMRAKYSRLIELVDQYSDSAVEMDDTQFEIFLTMHTSNISEISRATGIKIQTKADIYTCREQLEIVFDKCSSFESGKNDFINLLYDGSGSVNESIIDAHTGEFYVLWMNTEYCGNDGWNSFPGEISPKDFVIKPVCSIGDNCFYGCDELISFAIPDKATYIGKYAFANCHELSKVEMPDGVTGIGENAFANCQELNIVELPNSVTFIDEYAFDNCTSIKEVFLPDGITSIESGVFRDCSGLVKVVIPNSVRKIEMEAFKNCSSLRELLIPDGVTYIGVDAFNNCNRLTELRIPESVTQICLLAFCNCSGLTELTIPSGLSKIDQGVFKGCSGLKKLIIPDNVVTIGMSAFSGCSGLEKVEIPESVKTIDIHAFEECTNLTELVMPCGLEHQIYDSYWHWDTSPFKNCKKIKRLTFSGKGDMVEYNYIDYFMWHYSRSEIKYVEILEGVTSIGKNSFYNCSNISEVIIPSSIISIGDDSFYGCIGVTDVYYNGTRASWEKIDGHGCFNNATVHCLDGIYTETVPSLAPTPSPTPGPNISPMPTNPNSKPTANPTITAIPTKGPSEPSISKPTVKPTTIPTNAQIIALSIDKAIATVICGERVSLNVTLIGKKSVIKWKTSDKNIADVDEFGNISTKQAGSVTITATAAGESASCVVTVLYKDVAETKDFWYAPTNYLTANNVVKGYDNQTKFKPGNDCTRAQVVTFLWRLAGEPKSKTTTTKFMDVNKSAYYYKAVIWALEKGITTGVSKTKFNPSGVCSRAQTVTFLWRMAGKPEPKTRSCKFSDVKSKDYFYKATIWASEKKIVAGYDDGTFKPKDKCLRRQMVTFLYKYDKFVNGKG